MRDNRTAKKHCRYVGFAHLMDKFTDSPRISRRDGSIDVTESYIRASKVLYLRAFRASGRQRNEPDQASKIALSEHINRSDCRVE